VSDFGGLKSAILENAIVKEEVVLSSGEKSNYYIDLRRITLSSSYSPLVGSAMLELTRDLDYEAVGGLTLGADPVATSMMHIARLAGRNLDAFVVRKAEKSHGLQKRIEGPEVAGKRVLVVEDTSTTGKSLLMAVEALRDAGAVVVGCAVVVDRGARSRFVSESLIYRYLYDLQELALR
jgi:orotate phosphoribosyltransferase